MKKLILFFLTVLTLNAFAQEQEIDPTLTEVWTPVPEIVKPGTSGNAPSDALILFDGKNLEEWQNPQFKGEGEYLWQVEGNLKNLDPNFEHAEAGWFIENGEIVVNPGNGAIETKKKFNNFQLHIEWQSPVMEGVSGQGYSNSGIFLMSIYEVQVLNSYENKTYPNGQAGSIYKQSIPLVNASLPPGEWQVYDIIFKAPVFDKKGKVISPAFVTVLHNGVLIQNDLEIQGPTIYRGKTKYLEHPSKMPLRLQEHNNSVKYRNIWIREL